MSTCLISIYRQVYLNLPTEELKRVYVNSVVESELAELCEGMDIQKFVTNDVFSIVSDIEKLVAKYGIYRWERSDYPASEEVQLHKHSSGPLSVGVFEMSIQEDGLGDYFFSVYRTV